MQLTPPTTPSPSSTSTSTSTSNLQLLFLGTGTSTSLPIAPCLTLTQPYPPSVAALISSSSSRTPHDSTNPTSEPLSWNPKNKYPANIPCTSCRSAVDKTIHEGWKNRRGNTSVLLRKQIGGTWKNVVVDVGKSFRQQACRLFPIWGVQTVDAVILTHGHADAINGLDDLREWCFRQRKPIPVYLNRPTYEVVAKCFPYLVDKTQASGGGDVPSLTWNVIEDDARFVVEGIKVQSLPVHHGVYFSSPSTATDRSSSSKLGPEPLICLGFIFDNSIVYLSDLSDIPPSSWEILNRSLNLSPNPSISSSSNTDVGSILPSPPSTSTPPDSAQLAENKISTLSLSSDSTSEPPSKGPAKRLPILIIDALWPLRTHPSHYNLPQALSAALNLNPEMTYLVGFTHPITHYQWEKLGSSVSSALSSHHFDSASGVYTGVPNGVSGTSERIELEEKGHPQDEIKEGERIVTQFWADVQVSSSGLCERLKAWDGVVEPAWDGLGIEIIPIPSPKLDDVDRAASKSSGGRGDGWKEIFGAWAVGWDSV